MDAPRLKSRLFVQALMRTCEAHGLAAFRVAKGDDDAGSVCLKLNGLGRGFVVLVAARDASGAPVWLRATGPDPVDEAAADAYIEKSRRVDRDLWVVEIETKTLDAPLDAPLI